MKRGFIWVGSLAAVLLASTASASSTLNYQGRITAGGTNFSGTGFFKFVLVNGGGAGVWAHDGSPGSGEPGSATAVEVNNGLFTVELGQGMQAIPPVVFHESGLRLRTWFSRDGGGFEQLVPDVDIRPVDFAQFDTGRTLIVDPDGKGDFQDVQSAIDCFSTNFGYQLILIMPGYYPVSAPLTFPSNRWEYCMRGVGDARGITIENTGGAAAIPGHVRLENITLVGNPAVSDASSEPGYQLTCRQCIFSRSSPGGPTLRLETDGNASFIDCDASNDKGGDVLLASGNAQITARDSAFHIWSPSGNAINLDSKTRWSTFDGCDVDAWQSSGYSLLVSGGSNESAQFRLCTFNKGVLFTNAGYGATFEGGNLGNGLTIEGGGAQITFNECRLSGNGVGPAVRLSDIGNQGNLWLRNCDLHTVSHTTFFIKDAACEIRVKDCEIHSDSGNAIEVVVSAGQIANTVNIHRSRILSYGNSEKDAILITNDAANDPWQAQIALTDCEVSGQGGAIHSQGGEIHLDRSEIGADQCGCLITNGNLQARSSGIRGGLVMTDSWGDFSDCRIDAPWATEGATLVRTGAGFRRCSIEAWGNTAFRAIDGGYVEMESCNLRSDYSNTVALAASADQMMRAVFKDVLIQSYWTNAAAAGAALLLANAPGNESWRVGSDCMRCTIEANSFPDACDGALSLGGYLNLGWSSVTASRSALRGTNCEISLSASYASGRRHGIYAVGTPEVNITSSMVEAGDDNPERAANGEGVHIEADPENEGPLSINESMIEGYGMDPDQCRGVCMTWRNTNSLAGIIKSTIGSLGNALDITGGRTLIDGCLVYSDAGAAAVIHETDTITSFTGCSLYGMAGGNTQATLVLQGSLSNAPPTPRIWNCTFQPLMEPGTAAYSIAVAGGATSATVRLVNSVLSTNLAPEISIVTVRTNLVGGNVIP